VALRNINIYKMAGVILFGMLILTVWIIWLECFQRNEAYAFKEHLHVSSSLRNPEKCVLYEYDHIFCGDTSVHTGKILFVRVRGAGTNLLRIYRM
jgi:hypothetical protein